jgi:O-antigen/teichoic acid export membrane protein
MSSPKFILLKNAISNVVRGGSSAVVAIALPPFLTRLMSPNAYGAWSLVLQVSAYVGYLDFGIQTAVGRFVAYANEKGDAEHRDRIVSTSLAALSVAGILGLAGISTIAALIAHTFLRIPHNLLADAQLSLLLVASSLAIGLPASVFNGVFIGLQRYEIPAFIVGGSRIVSAVLLVYVVRQGGSLTRMGIAMAAVNLFSYGLQYLMYRKLVPTIKLSIRLISRDTVRELWDYCLSLSVWSLAMLLVSGLDVLLVGYFQFDAVAYYAVAATVITFLAGLQNAVFGVMIPAVAVEHARGDLAGIGRSIITATRYGFFLLLVTGLPLVFASRRILTVWVGAIYGQRGSLILQVLVIANIVRLSMTPYVMGLVGTGQQKLVIVTPLLEGFSNLVVSVIAGYFFGATGVAIGTLVGSVVGVAGNFFYNMRRTESVNFRITDYVRDGLLRPVICAFPLSIACIVLRWNTPSSRVAFTAVSASVIATIIVIWSCGLLNSEREKLRVKLLPFQV